MNYAEIERASAARLRGLATTQSWAEIARNAQQIAAGALDSHDEIALVAAARALDAFAQGGTRGGREAREAGVWAAAAFGAGGNGPSARVVIKRSFPKLSAQTGSSATLLCALAPTLRGELRAGTSLAALLDAHFRGECVRDAIWNCWESASRGDFSDDVWRLAQRALERALDASTSHVLDASRFPEGFVDKLSSRVPTLLPPQLESLERGLLEGGNALVALSPGTGKTLLGELFLGAALGRESGLGVFLVPYVALGRHVAAALREHLPPNVALHLWLGGHGLGDALDLEGASIAVATPERFDAIWRAKPELREKLRAVVVDEAHTLGEGARGARLEGLMARLKLANEAAPRVLALSAALEDAHEFASWLDARVVVEGSWTPTARRLAFWRQDGALEWHALLANASSEPLGEAKLVWPHPHLTAGDDFVTVRKQEPLAWENVAYLARTLHEERGGAILCLCATRRATRELAIALAANWPDSPEPRGARAKAIEAITERHRTLLPLADVLRRGVAWHNSSLPVEVRALIENAIVEGEIGVVAATSTLAEGVDLPFAQTIVAEWIKWDEGGQKPLGAALFRNIAGRCGRAGAFTEGDTLVFDNPLGPLEWTSGKSRHALQRKLYLGARLGQPRSALDGRIVSSTKDLADSVVDEIASADIRKDVQAALEAQLLGALSACPGATRDEITRAFYAHRVDEGFKGRVDEIWARFHADDLTDSQGILTVRGEAFARLDWSPATSRKLLGALESLPRGRYDDAAGAAKLNAFLWRALADVPEAGNEVARLFAPRSRLVVQSADLESVGRMWLEGRALEEMFAALPRAQKWPGLGAWLEHEERDEEASTPWSGEYDRWLDFARAGLETWTPWLWRAAAILSPLTSGAARDVSWRTWAERWEGGVDSSWATQALRAQAPGGRSAVAALGRAWPFIPAEPRLDPLALSPLREESGREAAERAFLAVIKAQGGAHCHAGKRAVALRDWVRARAGMTK